MVIFFVVGDFYFVQHVDIMGRSGLSALSSSLCLESQNFMSHKYCAKNFYAASSVFSGNT